MAFYLSDDYVDLIEQEIGIVIRISHLPDSSLVEKKVGENSLGCYASPEYIKEHGLPNNPNALHEHHASSFKNKNTTLDHWSFT